MTARSGKAGRHLWHAILIALSGLLISLPASATPAQSITSTAKLADGEQKIAAYHGPALSLSAPSPRHALELPAESHFAEARRVLIDLRDFVEDASTIVELDSRLKIGQRENDRLRQSLLSNRVARNAFESQMRPSETIVAALTRTVVRNWLETVEVEHRLEETRQELSDSEASWLDLERRVATLRATLSDRRAELHALRTERTALSVELGRLRREVSWTKAQSRQFAREQVQIDDASRSLRRNVAADLRQILLGSGHH